MSSNSACDAKEQWENAIGENVKEEEEESAAESEEVDQLLSSYRKNPPKKRSSSSIRRIDSPGATNEMVGDEVVVVSIERYEQPEIGSVGGLTENCLTSPGDNWLQNESSCSSTSLLRDLLPHLTESNTNAVTASPASPYKATFLTKTYTEPTSLSGLLRQMSNRLFSHYPSKVVIRHSKISPTASMHSKLDECNNGGVAATTTTEQVECGSLESDGGDGSSANLPATNSPTTPAVDQGKQEQLLRRPPVKTPLCKRCPHCKKTCSLRKLAAPESTYANDSRCASLPSNGCACRICMVLESVESSLSSPSTESGKTDLNQQASSASTFDWSAFSKDGACGGSLEGLLGPRHLSLGATSLELGMFCGECNGKTGDGKRLQEQVQTCAQMDEITYCDHTGTHQKSREQGIQVNSSSMISIATASSFGGPVCRICHSPGDKLEPLISPCRCLGTLKYVHASCLLHWLDISSRKLRRPPHCELCGYRYQRHKTMKLRRVQWPTCSRRDKLYHALFLVSVLMMVACAAVTIVCFKADRGQPRIADDNNVLKKATGGGAATVGAGGNTQVELSGQEVVTLVCGILFFCAFFVAMYVQVKAQTTVYKLCVRFWTMNQEWHVEGYRRERDAEYWRQRQEQQLQQQRRRASVQSSGVAGAAVHHSPSALNQEQQPSNRSFSLSQSSSTSFRADMLSGID